MESTTKTIGILREIKSKWERRCALTPKEVKELVQDGLKVLVQPSTSRCYTDEEFLEVGAVIQEDLSTCDVIFGVKEVPIPNLIEGKTYFFFSHTIKAQEYNMDLLDTMLEKRIRMIDYECIRENKEENAQRLVAFGRYAGIAGAFDFLRGIGEFMLQKQLQTPFIFMGSTYMYEDYECMKQALSNVHRGIAKSGTPKQYSPLVFAVTGTGRVSQGIIEVLEQLPHIKVEPDQLKNLKDMGLDNKKVIISVFTQKDLVREKKPSEEHKEFDKSHYYANPNEYESKFGEYLPYIHYLINGVYWESKYPRILSIDELRDQIISKKSQFLGVCDISCDYMGSVEFTSKFTSIEQPFLLYDPVSEEFYEKMSEANENTVLFHAVDHLPAEMPKEASNHFGAQLMPFVKAVANSDPKLPFEQMDDLPAEIRKAIICAHGELTPSYQYITQLRRVREQTKKHQEEYMQHVKEAERKNSSLRRGMRFATVVLLGHLFDSKFFNIAIDILESHKIDFRVIEWEIGSNTQKPSQVTLQLFAQDAATMDKVKEEIEHHAIEKKIKIYEGTGPAFDADVQQVHEFKQL